MRYMFPLTRILINIILAITSMAVRLDLGTTDAATPDLGNPSVVVHDGADPRWTETVTGALDRFNTAGLGTFAVDVHVWSADDSAARCRDGAGWFSAPAEGLRIDVCLDYQDTDLGAHLRAKLLLHELAHGWIHTHVDDDTRDLFMASHEMENWNDHDEPHNTRGTEVAANVLMYTLHPDEPTDTDQICGFELITSHPTPFGRTDSCPAT